MRSVTILVVEDEPAVRRMAKLILEEEGYEVYEAANASEALAVIRRLQCGVNLLVTDMLMPGIDGHELIRTVRQICPHTGTMGITGALAPADGRQRDYPVLLKPFSREQLLSAIKRILNVQL